MNAETQRAGNRTRIAGITLAIVVAAAALVWILPRLTKHKAAPGLTPVENVARRDIAVTVEATGSVEPIDLVEIKSKASGLIVKMPVEVGSHVRQGDLLVQVDPTNVKNQYDQAQAALHAAEAKLEISTAQKKRSDDLFSQQVITADEHDAATLDFANAQSSLVTARTNLELARQARDDATVRAPTDGTVLSVAVTAGTVISSATLSVGGGTSLLTMADLGRIRLRALVSESDIGSVQLGHPATVTVDAYPQRPFPGTVEKVEPQAVVQQSVTLFPVLISIANEQGLLLPGMNGEVSMLVDERSGALAVPMDAVRTAREIPAVATALGLDPDSVKAEIQRQIEARMAAVAADPRSDSAGSGGGASGDSTRHRFGGHGGGMGGWKGRGGGRGGSGGGMAGGGIGAGGMGAGGARGGGMGGGVAAAGFPGAGPGGRGARAQVVFVQTAHGLEPRVVRLGITNFDYGEVLGGLNEGDPVALLSVAELQAKRAQDQSRIRQRMGTGLPGSGGGGAGAGGRARGGGGR